MCMCKYKFSRFELICKSLVMIQALNAMQKAYNFSASDLERALWSAAAEHFTPKKDVNNKKLTNGAKRKTKATTTTQRSKKVKP